MKKDLEVEAWRLSFVNETVTPTRKIACDELLQVFSAIPAQGKVMLMNECAIHRLNRARNVYFWAKENPHCYEKLQHKTAHVMMWAALNARHVTGPYFFDGQVNHASYLIMIQEWFIPKPDELGIREVYFPQDGALAHYVLLYEIFLDIFPDK